MRFAAEVVAAMDATMEEMLDGVPDRIVAAGWRDAFRRNPRVPTDNDIAAIPTIWRSRVERLSNRVREVFGRSAIATRDQSSNAAYVPDDWARRVEAGMPAVDTPTIGDWRDLITQGTPLVAPQAADPMMETVRRNLSTIGDDLWVDVAAAIQEGRNAGEDVEQITARIQAVLNNAQWKARRIARTEITRAANAASLAQVLHSGYLGEKQWSSNTDNRVRPAHLEANEQARPLLETFDVGGFPMLYPGDPNAPPDLTINCRCDMLYALTPDQALAWMSGIGEGGPPADSVAAQAWDTDSEEAIVASDDGVVEAQSTMPEQLKRYWLAGEGAALIGWGTPGSFTRCVNLLRDDFPKDPEGLCANLEHEATGHWPGEGRGSKSNLNAGHTGAMIALVPRAEDAARFARDGGEPLEQLHVTMAFLGEAVDWPEDTRANVIGRMRDTYAGRGAVDAEAFSVNVFNPGTTNDREPCLVMGLSGDDVAQIAGEVRDHVPDVAPDVEMPEQHRPFVPHLTLRYMPDLDADGMAVHAAEAMGLVGPVTFDRLRVAFANEVTDIPLDVPQIDPGETSVPDDMYETDEPGWLGPVPQVDEDGAWSGVLTVEGIPSGDGRLFMPDSLDVAPLPLPLRWQREDAPGHEGAVIVGRIDDVWRDGPSIMGSGVLDMEDEDGREVHRKMRNRFLRGVSIEADMVDGEIVGDDVTEPAMEIYTSGRIRGATLLAIPAYVEGEIMLKDQPTVVTACACEAPSDSHTISIPHTPPAEWFEEPTDVEMHGALTVTDEGRVYGYLAPDGTPHRSFSDREVYVPRNVDYTRFMGSETLVAGGSRVLAGPITMGCGHASTARGVGADAALDHYDNTCSVVARIAVGENRRGVWVAGSLLSDVTPDQIERMMLCRLSGDWRPHPRRAGVKELTAALLVPVPGFAEARARASVTIEDGTITASSVPIELPGKAASPAPLEVVHLSLRRRLDKDRESRRAALAERFGRI
jgi:2'-5' RNA ligase